MAEQTEDFVFVHFEVDFIASSETAELLR